MSIAHLYQKYYSNTLFSRFFSLYRKLFLRSDAALCAFYRACGAQIGENVHIISLGIGTEPWLVSIGDNCYFSGNTQLLTHDGCVMQLYYMGFTDKKYDMLKTVRVGDNCFIGHGAYIMPGVHIGNNCFIGASSVVTHDIPDNSVVAGNPAKVIKSVSEYYEKNREHFSDTFGMPVLQKRTWCNENINNINGNRKQV